jgi:hypothetical protein
MTDAEDRGGAPVVTLFESYGSGAGYIAPRAAEALGVPFHEQASDPGDPSTPTTIPPSAGCGPPPVGVVISRSPLRGREAPRARQPRSCRHVGWR